MSTKYSRGPDAVIGNREARRKRGAPRKILTGGLALGIALTGLIPASGAFAWSSGGGANPGTGGSNGNYAETPYGVSFDDYNADGTPVQGVGLASMDYLMAFANAPQRYPNIEAACTQALSNADSQPGATPGQSRVIGIWWSAGSSGPFPTGSSYHQSDNYFWQNAWNPWINGGFAGLNIRAGLAGADLAAYDAAVNSALVGTGVTTGWDATTSAACIALSNNQPEPNYQLTLSTDHSANVPVVAGTQQAVYDTINASRGSSSISENVNAEVTLRWSGPESAADAVDASVSKTVSIANSGATRSPDFVPADFGWHSWPSGKFWFDVDVTKQGKMKDPASHAGVNDERENWTTPRDEDVVKYLTSGDPADPVADQEVFASGMFYNAVITAAVNGYESSMTITDSIHTDQVFIGSRTADVQDAAYMLDPEGNRVDGAQISIDRSAAGTVVVSGTVTDIPAAFQSRDYTLVVPTYFLPTGADYTVEDDSSVCYTRDVEECIEGNSESVRKVTPAPDKVWVLDETGALTAADPGHTNQEGADGKVFLMNDEVAAVVNGRIPANLAEPFSSYEIIDDWTDSARYVDFSDVSKAKVFIETAPGSGQYTNVSSDFDITVDGSVTTAKAKAGSQFLAQSKNSSSVDRKVKLVISGAFKDDYDTNGELVQLTNAGHEVWNNETVDTNVPPVFTWTPDPNKQVLGSADESGDKTYENIDGLSVFPGQKLEYSVGVDLRVPENTARGVKSLAVLDTYDPMFAPDKTSVEFWDSRDPRNPKPVPAKNYKLTFDEATNSFRADFTQEWIDANVNVEGANSEWQTKGWLTMRFTGTVRDTAPGGSTVKNQAFQIINGASTATEIPEVKIPEIEPDKEDLNVHTLENIDGKTVVQGDHLLYRLTLDARVSADELAYNVHKLGMVDDFDEEYLDLTEAGITVKNKATGEDVTDAFNIQVKDGVAYVFAKQVDSVNYYGEEIKGDPQPEDLEAYSKAAIDPHKTPIIDQSLLGHEYYILLDTVVSKEVDGYTIYNQATQNIQNTWHETKIVSNPLKDIDPDKDVVVSEETKDDSINEAEVKLYSDFNYRLNSSEIPANRAYAASQWQLKDTFDRVHDEFTGIWAIYANTDVYEGDTLVYKKGDLLQDSAGHETEPRDSLFDVKFDGESYTLTVDATQKYLDLVNTRMDLANSFSVYTKMIRIAPGEKIDNQVTETYNEVERESNIVWTSTPENPSINVEKYTLHEGWEQGKKGDRDDVKLAYPLDPANLGMLGDEGADGVVSEPLEIGFFFENDGDVPLKDVTFSDATIEDTFGDVGGIMCEVPVTEEDKIAAGEELGDTRWVSPGTITTLDVGERIDCKGTLSGMLPGMVHGDNVTVTGKSVFTDKQVSDEDPWFAAAPSTPGIDIEKYTLSEGVKDGDRDAYKDALALTPEQAKDGVQIGFDITNTGDEPLKELDFSDVTNDATTGKVEDIRWAVPEGAETGADRAGLVQPAAGPADTLVDVATEVVDGAPVAPEPEAPAEGAEGEAPVETEQPAAADTVEIDGVKYELRSLDELKDHVLMPGETVTLVGVLKGVEEGTGHQNTADVEGIAVYSGTKVSDDDPWNAKLPSVEVPNPPCGCDDPSDPKGAVTGDPLASTGGQAALWAGIALLILAAGATTAWAVSRKRRAELLTAAGVDEAPLEQ